VIIGPDEAAQGTATVRDLRSGAQQSVAQDQMVETIQNMLA
jgi:histidyl-tRNA synthetase